MIFEDIPKLSWPKLMFSALVFVNGLIVVAAIMIACLMIEPPTLGRMLWATAMINITLIVIIGTPTLVAFGIMFLYCIIKGERISLQDESSDTEQIVE